MILYVVEVVVVFVVLAFSVMNVVVVAVGILNVIGLCSNEQCFGSLVVVVVASG